MNKRRSNGYIACIMIDLKIFNPEKDILREIYATPMTKKDFFRTGLKLFGLYSFIAFLLSGFTSNLYMLLYRYEGKPEWSAVFAGIGVLAIAIAFVIVLIYKCDTIIDWLQLDKGFDDDRIVFDNFNNQNLIKFSAIIIGGLLIIDHLPSFLNYCVTWVSAKNTGAPRGAMDNFYWAINAMDLLIGYLLLTNYSLIPGLLKIKNSDEEKTT